MDKLRKTVFLCLTFLGIFSLLSGCGGSTATNPNTGNPNSNNTTPVPTIVVNAGASKQAEPGARVVLDGSASSAASNNALSYSWSFNAQPKGSTAVISNPADVNPSFVANATGTYIVQLAVVDSSYATSARDLMQVTAENLLPQAFDHTGISGNCIGCHNNTVAVGKTSTHIPTSDVCEACHSTLTFNPAVPVDHNEVIGLCSDCHNNVLAIGKPANHIPTTAECDICHAAGVNWSELRNVLAVRINIH